MKEKNLINLSYYPGCSLKTSARENNASLIYLFRHLGYNLVELEDWNCCGSSSAHSVDTDLAFDLASRNLSLAPVDRPLLVACPSCLLRLRHAYLRLENEAAARQHYEKTWHKPFDPKLQIMHFFEFLDQMDLLKYSADGAPRLAGLKFVPYYGCMLARPPIMRHEKNYHGLMERILTKLGATAEKWSFSSRCCGTFLTVARPEIVQPMVNEIIQAAIDAKADCIVTACAMCHMNLEMRCSLKERIPILHFSEIISLALGIGKKQYKGWFSRHLVNPKPLLKALDLF
ncbi:MAG: heterodisulfide reductase-related iron-sulfur binding cluster [Desulfobacterales bacterium]|jgi:heterodisulfide reductase subunit B